MPAVATAEQLPIRHERRPCLRPGGVTIGQLLTSAHEAAHTDSAASCPMCGGGMSGGPGGRESRCGDCGTRLS